MILKVKGGVSNPWGPLGVSHVSPPCCSVVSWGHLLAGRENHHHHAHACTHSPRRTFWVADGLPTMLIMSLSISSHGAEIKGSTFLCLGVLLSSCTALLIGETFFLLVTHRTCVYSTIAGGEGCVGFIAEKGPLLSNAASEFRLWNDLCFIVIHAAGLFYVFSHILLLVLCLFPSCIVQEYVPFFHFSGLCNFL